MTTSSQRSTAAGPHPDAIGAAIAARRTPARPAVDAVECPSCQWFDAIEREAYRDPEGVDHSRLTDARVLRLRHAGAGECLSPGGAGGG
ncbi:hypothetical protein [Kitasatospora sp. NPDC090091]|uniref:hypothetical protein n=1 Tax=Kitasatospora sp. NPDC090091 TaxID=3364081 RepID=UPI0038130551